MRVYFALVPGSPLVKFIGDTAIDKGGLAPPLSELEPRQNGFNFGGGADMWEKMCNYTARSCIRPRQSMGGVACGPKICNFILRSVVRPRQPIVIFDKSRQTVGKNCNFTSHSCVLRVAPTSCHFTTRSRARPRQSGRVAHHDQNVQLLPCVQALDHANPWEGLPVAPTLTIFAKPLLQILPRRAKFGPILSAIISYRKPKT